LAARRVRLQAFSIGLALLGFAVAAAGQELCAPVNLGDALPVSVYGSTVGSLNAMGGSGCGTLAGAGGDTAPDVVYQWTAPAAGYYVVLVRGYLGFEPLLSLRDGSCSGPELACNNGFPLRPPGSEVLVSLAAGQTVMLTVDGNDAGGGDYGVLIWATPEPCTNALLLSRVASTEATSASYPPGPLNCVLGAADVPVARTAAGDGHSPSARRCSSSTRPCCRPTWW
jgi:hypothetical protein